MKAYQIEQFGLDGLRQVDRPQPVPGPQDVIVRIRAVSLNFRDLLVTLGRYNPRMPLPRIPCSDGAGEVVEVGPGVRRVRVGDRVAGTFFQNWIDGPLTDDAARSALGGSIDGVMAEYVAFHEDGLVRIPDYLSDEEAATLPCAALTAWHALFEQGRPRPGDTLLLQGTGGVSLFALQFARLAGLRAIITSSSSEKLERALTMGATDGINYRSEPQWEHRVRELTDGVGVDHVIELGGARTLPQSMEAVRMGGRISLIGVLGGGDTEFNQVPILMRNIRLQGIYVGNRRMFESMLRAMALHEVRPTIDRVFGFDEFRAALEHMQRGAHFGKIVVRV